MNRILATSFSLFSMSVLAETQTYKFESSFNGMRSAEFISMDVEGHRTLKGNLISDVGQRYSIPNVCEPEGGNAELIDAYVIKAKKDYFSFTCAWSVQHSGIGINGVQYEAFVYAAGDLKILKKISSFSEALSGYEGTLEDGDHGYAWYTNRKIAGKKIYELEAGEIADSISLAHEVILTRLNNRDYAAIKAYLTEEHVKQLVSSSPISKFNVVAYNDLGFALGQAGEDARAYALLAGVETVAPDRIVLILNIADTLWSSDKGKARVYYQKYIEMMHRAGKKALIPAHAIERSAVK